jgi:hypothetical protein
MRPNSTTQNTKSRTAAVGEMLQTLRILPVPSPEWHFVLPLRVAANYHASIVDVSITVGEFFVAI